MFLASHNSSDTTDDERRTNHLSDYEISKEIGKGSSSVVYVARCKKGRLRNRDVALKQFTSSLDGPSSATSFHQRLYHPNIMALYQVIQGSSATPEHHVMELCARGTLHDYLIECNDRSGALPSEPQVRGVAKGLLDALVYLRKEGIVHRNISPESVLLTAEFRPKLSGFRYAIPAVSPLAAPEFPESPEFSSPELIASAPHSYPTDIWSLGCVLIACYIGKSPFDGASVAETCNNISQGRYQAPRMASPEAGDLVGRMLSIVPTLRIDPSAALLHPFFSTSSPVITSKSKDPHAKENICALPPFPKRHPSKHVKLPLAHESPLPASHLLRKSAFSDIGNVQLRRILQDDVHGNPAPKDAATGTSGERRIVSDPLPRRRLVSFLSSRPNSPTPLVPSVKAQPAMKPEHQPPKKICDIHLPIGATRPLPIDISLLNPQTHKTIQGQIVITPSRTLVIDLREGERRSGNKGGDRVMVVAPTTSQVRIIYTPEPGAPVPLEAADEEYSLAGLPNVYWKQYNMAERIIEQIKQRTPQLIMYTRGAKCTLWANTPKADIELLFRSFTKSIYPPNESPTTMRIRLSRKQHTIEIMRFLKSAEGGEWVRKELAEEPGKSDMGAASWTCLDDVERDGLKSLADFLRTCEAVEALTPELDPSSAQARSPLTSSAAVQPPLISALSSGEDLDVHSNIPSPTSTAVRSLSSVHLAPRPSKLSKPLLGSSTGDDLHVRSALPRKVIFEDSIEAQRVCVDKPSVLVMDPTDILPTWLTDTSDFSVGVQTRFIPSVGWCVRYSSRVSQGGRYKIMFMDGATLDIDVDEDWAEYSSPAGDVSRHNIRDSVLKRRISDRMKVFQEFVSMFDESACT